MFPHIRILIHTRASRGERRGIFLFLTLFSGLLDFVTGTDIAFATL